MLFSLLTDRRKFAYGIAFCVLLAWITGIAVLVAKTGCSHQDDMPWDTMILLDGAYRVHTGQMPHVDYLSPTGAFPFWLASLGMTLGGVNANAIAYGMALGFVVVTLLAWGVCARRFSAVFALTLALLAGGLIVATRPLAFGLLWYSWEFAHASYAMGYNRIGWALLCILAVVWLLPPAKREGSKAAEAAESLLAGCLTVALALTKINYLAAALAIGFAGLVLTRGGWRRLFWYAAGLAVIPVLLWTFSSFSFRAYLGDIATVGRLADSGERLMRMARVFAGNLAEMLLVVATYGLLRPFFGKAGLRMAVLCGGCVAVGWVVLALNTQWREIPLLAVACAILLETALRSGVSTDGPGGESFRFRFLMGAAIFFFLFGRTFLSDAASVGYSWAVKNHMRYSTPDSALLQAESLSPMLLPPQGGEEVERSRVVAELLERRNFSPSVAGRLSLTPYQYAHLVNDGVALVRPHVNAASRVFCMDSANPFPLALRLPAPKGGALWWDKMTFNRRIFPAPERALGEVTHVMVPKSGVNSEDVWEVYRPYVTEHFRHLDASALWDLYVRKEPLE